VRVRVQWWWQIRLRAVGGRSTVGDRPRVLAIGADLSLEPRTSATAIDQAQRRAGARVCRRLGASVGRTGHLGQ
jgi:hypothetical protein